MSGWPKLDLNIEMGDGKCFCCGQNNPVGLKLKFDWDGTTASAAFNPNENLQGWSGYLHGGITACVLDEAMTWAALLAGTNSITAKIEVRYRKLVSVEGKYTVSCTITRKTPRLIETAAKLTDKNGEILAEGTSTHFVVNHNKEKLQ